MSSSSGPNSVTNGLVFEYDINNTQKSWKGAPTTNLYVYSNSFSSWNKSGGISSVVDNVALSPSGNIDASLVTANGTTNSYIYVGTQQTAGLTYTRSVYAKANTTGTLVFEWYDNNGSGGIAYLSTIFDLITGTVTSSSSGNIASIIAVPGYPGWYRCAVTRSVTLTSLFGTIYIGTYGAGTGSLYLYGAQTEQSSFATPLVITNGTTNTRSNTQAILDLTNNNTITASSLTYASDGSFSFNGTSDIITVPSTSYTNLSSSLTASAWIYYVSGNGRFFQKDGPSNTRCWEMGGYGGTFRMEMWHSNGTATIANANALTVNGWTHCALTFDGTNIIMYQNGTPVTTVNFPGDIRTDVNTPLYIGGYWGGEFFNGKVSNCSLYNRALSASEIKQNFNAMRSRFGI